MEKEFRWTSKSGKAYFHAGFGQQDAVGAPKPSDAIPLQEGARLLFAKGVERIWGVMIVSAVLHLIRHRSRKLRSLKRKRRK